MHCDAQRVEADAPLIGRADGHTSAGHFRLLPGYYLLGLIENPATNRDMAGFRSPTGTRLGELFRWLLACACNRARFRDRRWSDG